MPRKAPLPTVAGKAIVLVLLATLFLMLQKEQGLLEAVVAEEEEGGWDEEEEGEEEEGPKPGPVELTTNEKFNDHRLSYYLDRRWVDSHKPPKDTQLFTSKFNKRYVVFSSNFKEGNAEHTTSLHTSICG